MSGIETPFACSPQPLSCLRLPSRALPTSGSLCQVVHAGPPLRKRQRVNWIKGLVLGWAVTGGWCVPVPPGRVRAVGPSPANASQLRGGAPHVGHGPPLIPARPVRLKPANACVPDNAPRARPGCAHQTAGGTDGIHSGANPLPQPVRRGAGSADGDLQRPRLFARDSRLHTAHPTGISHPHKGLRPALCRPRHRGRGSGSLTVRVSDDAVPLPVELVHDSATDARCASLRGRPDPAKERRLLHSRRSARTALNHRGTPPGHTANFTQRND